MYPIVLPQNAIFPAITYQVLNTTRLSAFGTDVGVVMEDVSIYVWGKTALSVDVQANAVVAALQRYRGTLDSTEIQDIFIEDRSDFYEDETETYRSVINIQVDYTE